jgi:hypothetical protein
MHFKNPCPVPIDCSLAACWTLISVSKSTEPRSKVLDVHGRNWFLENDPFKRHASANPHALRKHANA